MSQQSQSSPVTSVASFEKILLKSLTHNGEFFWKSNAYHEEKNTSRISVLKNYLFLLKIIILNTLKSQC